jgi:hypothetical protein
MNRNDTGAFGVCLLAGCNIGGAKIEQRISVVSDRAPSGLRTQPSRNWSGGNKVKDRKRDLLQSSEETRRCRNTEIRTLMKFPHATTLDGIIHINALLTPEKASEIA